MKIIVCNQAKRSNARTQLYVFMNLIFFLLCFSLPNYDFDTEDGDVETL
jgi:hypothetical protein